MILDRIENEQLWSSLGSGVAQALDYLLNTDFTTFAAGRRDIDGDRLFAIVNRGKPNPLSNAIWEAHRRYWDVQCVITGRERMGWLPLDEAVEKTPYDEAKDAAFYEPGRSFFIVAPGGIALFAPTDVHAPGLRVNDEQDGEEILKIVVKVSRDLVFDF